MACGEQVSQQGEQLGTGLQDPVNHTGSPWNTVIGQHTFQTSSHKHKTTPKPYLQTQSKHKYTMGNPQQARKVITLPNQDVRNQ